MISQYSYKLSVKDPEEFFNKALSFSKDFEDLLITDCQSQAYPLGGFRKLILLGSRKRIFNDGSSSFFHSLQKERVSNDFLGGYFGYDLKNQLADLKSELPDPFGFEEGIMLQPEVVIEIIGNEAFQISPDSQTDYLEKIDALSPIQKDESGIIGPFQPQMSKSEYLDKVQTIRELIKKGTLYELNLSQAFISEASNIDIHSLYAIIRSLNPVPFSFLFRSGKTVVIGASPERFLKKEGSVLWSQPMKGTRPRSSDPKEDERLKNELMNSEKEIAENMMIMDLVRNDLAKSSETGSIEVEELFKVYSFKTVHQMITTVKGRISGSTDPVEAIANAFPMGSMTGAPKIKAMEWIENLESTKRGIYSGAMGYFDPNGDFDFSVCIRGLMYNIETGILGYHVGGAITWDSDPEQEYLECQWKSSHWGQLFKK